MKTIILLLFAATAFAQSPKLTLCSGAGTNPRHIESLGAGTGWVEIWVGPMATGEQVLKIYPEHWGDIETISVLLYGLGKPQHTEYIITHDAQKTDCWFGITAAPKNIGTWIRIEYAIKYRKA